MRKVSLMVFDGDGTVWHYPVGKFGSSWDAISHALGVYNQTSKLMEKYYKKPGMDGIWAAEQVALFGEKRLSLVHGELYPIPYTKGFKEFAEVNREREFKAGLLTTGLDLIAERAALECGLDFCYCNRVHRTNGQFSGTLDYVVPMWEKHLILRKLAKKIPKEELVFVGDSKNDIPCLQMAGLGVAFNPKDDEVRQAADVVISDFRELQNILRV